MIRMARVGVDHVNDLADQNSFVRAVHVTGDLETLGHGTRDDQRYFVTVADERTILHFGSSYGGNALLGKIAHGLRQAAYDGWASGEFLAEQFMLLGITDKADRPQVPHLRRLPERVGQDQPGHDAGPRRPRRPLPRRLLRRRHRLAVGRPEGREDLRDQPRVRRVRRRQGHQRGHQPDRAGRRSPPGTGTIFTNVAYNENTHEVWWEGKTTSPRPTSTGWLDWKGNLISERPRPAATSRGRTRTAGSPPRWPTCPTSPRTSRTPRACRSTRSSSAAAPATASRWSGRSPTSPRASTTA